MISNLNIPPSLTFAELVDPLRTGQDRKIAFWTVHRRRNGTEYPVEVHLQLETFNGHDVFVAIILDISELKRVESLNNGLSQIFNDSLNEIYVFDAVTLRFVEVNQGACRNIGYTIDELHEMTPLDIKPEMNLNTFSSLLMPLRLGQKAILDFVTVHRRKDGTEYPVEVHLQLSTFNSQPVFMAIILDITERLISEQAKLDFAMKSERMWILKQFISDTSHEFRTPMSVINTKLYLLRKTATDERQREHLNTIEQQVIRLERLVEGLHRLTELDALDNIQRDRVDLPSLLDDVCQDVERKMPDNPHEVIVNIQDGIEQIEADGELLRLALSHLLKNAAQYSPNKGVITVDVYTKDEYLHCNVHDTGIGIPEDEHERIFERLYRIDPSRSSDTGGAGLGLAIVQRIVELHHGSISVKSEVNNGSCFCLQIPIEQVQQNLPSLILLTE